MAEVTAISKRKILLIEDDQDSGRMIQYLLEMDGHEVRIARDGAKGLTAAAEWGPEIVISDIGLPGPLDGYDVARELRFGDVCPFAFLVALSGRALAEDIARARVAGFDRHVVKPVDTAVLEEIVACAPMHRSARTLRAQRAAPRA